MITATRPIVSTPAPGSTFPWVNAEARTYIVPRPFADHPQPGKSKYNDAFFALDFNEPYLCEARHTNRVATAMRKYVNKYEPGAIVVTQSRCDDGMGRVFKRQPLQK